MSLRTASSSHPVGTRRTPSSLGLVAALAIAGSLATLAAPASAQYSTQYDPRFDIGAYRVWRPAWDRSDFDRHHVIVGTVSSFAPYRLHLQHRDGYVQTIDLKHGTVILPTGSTPQPNQHVAAIGYYSDGTFVAKRIILRG